MLETHGLPPVPLHVLVLSLCYACIVYEILRGTHGLQSSMMFAKQKWKLFFTEPVYLKSYATRLRKRADILIRSIMFLFLCVLTLVASIAKDTPFLMMISLWIGYMSLKRFGSANTVILNAVFVMGTVQTATLDYHTLMLIASVRYSARLFLMGLLGDVRFTAPMNFVNALVLSWRHIHSGQVPASDVSFLVAFEFASWVITSMLCIMQEITFKELMRSERAAGAIKHATENLLHSFCDAMLRLTPDLRIAHATPQLTHLMSPENPILPEMVNGTLFRSHVAGEHDQQCFDDFISKASRLEEDNWEQLKSAAPALCVNLRNDFGNEIPVSIFHVVYSTQSDEPEHLLGIAEQRPDGKAPDESLFKGRRTSFKACMVERASHHRDCEPLPVQQNQPEMPQEIGTSSSGIFPPQHVSIPPEFDIAVGMGEKQEEVHLTEVLSISKFAEDAEAQSVSTSEMVEPIEKSSLPQVPLQLRKACAKGLAPAASNSSSGSTDRSVEEPSLGETVDLLLHAMHEVARDCLGRHGAEEVSAKMKAMISSFKRFLRDAVDQTQEQLMACLMKNGQGRRLAMVSEEAD